MKNKLFTKIGIVIVMMMVLVISGCGSNKPNFNDLSVELKNFQLEQIHEQIKNGLIDQAKLVDANQETKQQIAAQTTSLATSSKSNPNAINKMDEVIKEAYDALKAIHPNYMINEDNLAGVGQLILVTVKTKASDLIYNYRQNYELNQYYYELTQPILEKYQSKVSEATTTVEITGNQYQLDETSTNVYQVVLNFTIEFNKKTTEQQALRWYSISEDGFFSFLFNNGLVVPVGWLLQFLSIGNYYIIGIFLLTILIRTAMWPVYTKSNDMSLKMGIMKPHLAEIEKKYEGRTDETSLRMKQMETMQLYRKYKVGLGGCLMPLLQFPIFMAVFRAISKMPFSDGRVSSALDWNKKLNPKFLGINLFEGRGDWWSGSFWAVLVIIVIVVGTQILQQFYMMKKQRLMNEKAQENVPEYRRQAVSQNQTEKTMKYMMYFMIFMMASFVWSSPAGLGIYWCIGNVYSLGQMFINNKLTEKRKLQLVEKYQGGKR